MAIAGSPGAKSIHRRASSEVFVCLRRDRVTASMPSAEKIPNADTTCTNKMTEYNVMDHLILYESSTPLSITYPHNFADERGILRRLDHEVGYVRARDGETKSREMAFTDPIIPSPQFVRKPGRAHDGEIESAFFQHFLHPHRIP